MTSKMQAAMTQQSRQSELPPVAQARPWNSPTAALGMSKGWLQLSTAHLRTQSPEDAQAQRMSVVDAPRTTDKV